MSIVGPVKTDDPEAVAQLQAIVRAALQDAINELPAAPDRSRRHRDILLPSGQEEAAAPPPPAQPQPADVKCSERDRPALDRGARGFGASRTGTCRRLAIGFGHTYGITEQTPAIGREEADDLLEEDITGSYGPAIDALGLPLTQAQFDAVCSFVYQLGIGVLSRASPSDPISSRATGSRPARDAPVRPTAGVPFPSFNIDARSSERCLARPMPASSSLAVLNRPERAAAARYESLLAQGVSDHEQLPGCRLALLRQLVWAAAVRGQGSNGSQVSPGWDIDLRRERYAVLAKLSGWTA